MVRQKLKSSGTVSAKKLIPRIRRYFLAGFLVTAPLGITALIAWWIINFIDEWVTPLVPTKYNPETYLPFSLPGLGLLILFISLTLIGALTAGLMGRWVVRTGERILNRMPVVRSVYSAIKQIFETILAQQSNAFREAVLIEYPRRGIWAIGFITGTTKGEVQNLTLEETVNIFLPTTPNPTSGFLLFVPREEVVPLDMSVEEAVKMVISGGIVTPPDRRSTEKQQQPIVSSGTYEEMDILREKDKAPILVSKRKI
ncbi:MAG TPA: DUF502 domain-containing protein [Rhodospirillales bacterium]|nr:MAG: hypothetical protein CFH07_01135 [Alphaproteobacteria bacterium MarineAlpha3_Bin6]HIA82347.1 DUF502 domain-containing protein [Rhodospirillales bacterium]HIC60027.1 DUF502 domain-containing protein [Rhodospirillales bacterium]|tara:strand:- start:620 stop:1387 length:768 start_codon:yes stop_codon:yes gene_type:complete